MLKRHETHENFHYFKYKPKPYSDSVQIRWPVDSQCIALSADVAGFLLKMLWARHPTDEEIAWWNDLIDQTEAVAKAAEPEPEQPVEATGAQTLLAATQAPAAQETVQEAVDNGANGTGGVHAGTAAEGGAPEGEEESKEGEQPSEEEGSKEGEEKPSEEQKETEVTSTKKKSSATKGLL